jgi:hypothetical protein
VSRDEVPAEIKQEPFYKAPDPALVTSPRLEKRLLRSGVSPIGSRRRRAALQDSLNIPFEQLPYQCFQEARKVLQADREEKLKEIARERDRIARLRALSDEEAGGANVKRSRLGGMEKHLEQLKIWADINDPVVKKKFEDGEGKAARPNWYIQHVLTRLHLVRRHEQTGLPIPGGSKMERISTPNRDPTNYPDEGDPRCFTSLRPYRRCQALL